MVEQTFIVDDIVEARRFVASLDRKTKQLRFSSNGDWKPDHIVLVARDGVPVAMADCVLSDDKSGANVSLVASRGFGAFAVKALLELKRRVDVSFWEATLRKPTAATIAISRRFLDCCMDQGAWELSNELVRRYGPRPEFVPTPLTMPDRLLKRLGVPAIHNLDVHSVRQILATVSNPKVELKSPTWQVIDRILLPSLAFDVLKTPMTTRQHVIRFSLLARVSMAGYAFNVDEAMRIINRATINEFFKGLMEMNMMNNREGIFAVAQCSPAVIEEIESHLNSNRW